MAIGVMVAVGVGLGARVGLLVGCVSSLSVVVGDRAITCFDGMPSLDALDTSPIDIPEHPTRKMDTSRKR